MKSIIFENLMKIVPMTPKDPIFVIKNWFSQANIKNRNKFRFFRENINLFLRNVQRSR